MIWRILLYLFSFVFIGANVVMLSFVKSTQLFQDSLMQYNHRINETESFSLYLSLLYSIE